MPEYHKYAYDGPVMEFDECATRRWHGETVATSLSKARNNLTYQYKKSNSRAPATKISLPGKIRIVD